MYTGTTDNFPKMKKLHIFGTTTLQRACQISGMKTQMHNLYWMHMWKHHITVHIQIKLTNLWPMHLEEHEKSKFDAMQMICTLGNTLLSLQQMSTQQAVHIVLPLPLNNNSRGCIFINTSPIDQHTFVLKLAFLLKQGPDDSQYAMCQSIIDYYIERTHSIKNICLLKFVSKYINNGTHVLKRKNQM